MIDFLSTAWVKRYNYQIAMVEVYSGPAFIWAEVLGSLLSRIRKPYL